MAKYGDGEVKSSFQVEQLFGLVSKATEQVNAKLKIMKETGETGEKISIEDMFEMQMLMNHLAQISEMSTGVVSASNSAIGAMARGLKQ